MVRRSQVDRNPDLVWQAWLVTRIALVVSCFAVVVFTNRSFLMALSGWDVEHYITVATDGYVDPVERAFFPGLPLLLRLGSLIGIPMPITGALLATAGSALAALALLRMAGVIPAVLWLCLPMSVFTTVGYTEAPFAAAAFWAWHKALDRQWGQASLFAAIACTFRVSGVFLVIALAVLALTEPGKNRNQRLFWLIIPVLPVLAFFGYLYAISGDPLAWFHAQQAGWGRELTNPITAFQNTLNATDPQAWPGRPAVPVMFALEIVSMAVGIVTTIYCATKKWWGEATWVGIQLVAFATSTWFISVNRAVLLWFPFCLMMGNLMRYRPVQPAARIVWIGCIAVYVAVSFVAMIAWAVVYYSGQWAS